MSTEAAILADIVHHPDDDLPRLVFADWLDDHGRGDRAEFIRLQVQRARLDDGDPRVVELRCREQYLLARHGKGWIKRELRRKFQRAYGPEWSYRRGMIEAVSLSPEEFAKDGPELFERLPIRFLRMLRAEALAKVPLPNLSRLTDLELVGSLWNPPTRGHIHLMQALAGSRLRGLRLETAGLSAAFWNAVSERLVPGALEHLRLRLRESYPSVVMVPLQTILASPATSGLRQLEVRGPHVNATIADLIHCPQAAQLEGLTHEEQILNFDLAPWRWTRVSLHGLAAGLRRLCLRRCWLSGSTTLDELLSLPALSGLHTLVLEGFQLPVTVSPRVLTMAHFSLLTTLSLAGLRLGDDGFAEIASSPTHERLTTLDLARTGLTAESLYWLVESPHLRGLRRLSLAGNLVGEGVWALVESDLLPRLCWLDLSKAHINDKAALALAARAPKLLSLAWLDLRGNALSAGVCARLREAFGPTVRYQRLA